MQVGSQVALDVKLAAQQVQKFFGLAGESLRRLVMERLADGR